jgi:predicted Zn-ribbon and HTH transcriptional regulator
MSDKKLKQLGVRVTTDEYKKISEISGSTHREAILKGYGLEPVPLARGRSADSFEFPWNHVSCDNCLFEYESQHHIGHTSTCPRCRSSNVVGKPFPSKVANVKCQNCGHDYRSRLRSSKCPECGQWNTAKPKAELPNDWEPVILNPQNVPAFLVGDNLVEEEYQGNVTNETLSKRARLYFSIGDLEWEALSEEEKEDYISRLPGQKKRSGGGEMSTRDVLETMVKKRSNDIFKKYQDEIRRKITE